MLTYTYRYNRTIQWFKAHKPSSDILCETHHIIPRSMGGDNSPENLVDLPIRWHYIVHCWLPAVYLEQGNREGYEKMLYAWNRMQNYRRERHEVLMCIKEDSRLYQQLKEAYVELASNKGKLRVGGKNNQFKHHWWKDPTDKTRSKPIKDGDPVPEGWVRGRWFSPQAVENMSRSNAHRGKRLFYDPQTGKRSSFAETDIIPDGWLPWKPTVTEEMRQTASERTRRQRARELAVYLEDRKKELEPMYQVYLAQGFKAMQEQFGYPYSHANFLQCVQRCLPEKFAYRFKKTISTPA